jgi:hypothetical protein
MGMKGRMPGLVAHVAGPMILLLFLALPRGVTAQNLPSSILLGKWCGEAANYVFSNQKLSVYGPNGQLLKELAISRFETGADWITVFWAGLPAVDGIEANTLFGKFSPNREAMEQAPVEIAGNERPRRIFRRC